MPIVTFDLHNHLVEKKLRPEQWWKAVAAKKIDVIAITEHIEHDPVVGFEALEAIKPDKVVLLPGMELNTSIGHVLALGETAEIYEIEELLELHLPIERAIEIAKQENFLLSIAHPWGFRYDSAFHYIKDDGIKQLIKKEKTLGVEAFNGMVGHVSFLAFDSNWVNKPRNWLDYLEKNRVARKTRINKLGARIRKTLDKKMVEIVEKSGKAMELGEEASFATAGSDAHLIEQIGTGIMKMNTEKIIETPKQALEEIRNNKQNIVWIGPYVMEVREKVFEIERIKTTKKQVFEAIKYAAKDFLLRKTGAKSRIEKIQEKLRKRRREKRKKTRGGRK